MTTKFIGFKDFRQNLSKYQRQAAKHGWRYVVLLRNVPVFDVRPLSKKDAVLEKLAADIADARQAVSEGRTYALDEVERHLGLK